MTWLLSPEPPAAALTVPSVREVILSVSSEDETVSAVQLTDIISELTLYKEQMKAVQTVYCTPSTTHSRDKVSVYC